jgi:hypothetical protein
LMQKQENCLLSYSGKSKQPWAASKGNSFFSLQLNHIRGASKRQHQIGFRQTETPS